MKMTDEEMAEEEKLALDYSYKVEPLMDVGIDNSISVYCRQDVEQAYLDGYLAGLKAGRPKQKELLKKIEKIVYSGENEIKRLSQIVDILAEAEQFLKEK